jgi:hypothetical protein
MTGVTVTSPGSASDQNGGNVDSGESDGYNDETWWGPTSGPEWTIGIAGSATSGWVWDSTNKLPMLYFQSAVTQ